MKTSSTSKYPCIWKPQMKQAIMMSRGEDEGLYGGAAGGGKSDYLIIEALRQVHIRNYRGLLLRKTYPQLEALIDRSLDLYPRAFPRARYNSSEHKWRFPSGASITFGSMQYAKDRTKYQGRAFDFVGFDELTHFTWDEYNYLFSRNRPTGPGTRAYIRATANPGGVGHGWVKERFITAMEPYETKVDVTSVRMPNGKTEMLYRTRIFIPSTVFDNEILLKNDPNYLASLASMPYKERQALLYGDWDSFSGQVFMEFKDDPEGYQTRKWSHVIEPFDIPEDWSIYCGFDFGFSKPYSVGWYAVDHNGCIYRIRELYGCMKDQPNTGVQDEPMEIARKIKEVEATDPNLKGRHIRRIADPAIFEKSKGESIAEMMERGFVSWEPGDHTRLAGKMQFHYRLAFDEKGKAMLYVFNTCQGFIRTIPSLVYDEKKVEDVDTAGEDHIYDECRYVLMEHPIAPRKNVKKDIPQEDPLDLFKDEKKPYYFFRV